MIELDNDTLRQLQRIELEILIEIDRICRKNKIYYSLTGGTLLGAVRCGGFIPWDDDADISMMRSEYIKFQKACKTDLDSDRFYFQDIDSTKGYRWGYGKVRRKNTVFLREHQEHMPYEQGVFVDIFPRDGVPDGYVAGKMHTFACFTMRKIMWSSIGKNVAVNKWERAVYSFLARIPEDVMKKAYEKLVKLSNYKKNSELVRALTFPLPNEQKGYRRSWYKKYTQVKFENRKFMVQASYKEWLESEFGNYMQLPPVEQRKIHPVSQLKLVDLEELGENEYCIIDGSR